MKYYEQMLGMGCFTREQLAGVAGTLSAANMAIYEYQKKGLIEKVRRNFYAVISLETKQPVLSRYQLASRLFEDAYLSHHSAFEVYGYANQVYYDCFVASRERFSDFEYGGVTFHRVERRPEPDIVESGRVKTSSIEQTVVDSLRDFEKISGLEEVLRCLLLVPSLSERKMLDCLKKNGNGFLYQKCGYVFEDINREFHFSDGFFKACEENSSGAKRYLSKNPGQNVYHKRWKLYAPAHIGSIIDKGVDYYDAL